MNNYFVKSGLMIACASLVAACVNDDYDLSDIDTTTQIKVENLTLPVNIDVVTLGDIITFDEDSKIQPVVIDGVEMYALTENGTFSSDPITIDRVTAPAPVLPAKESYLDQLLPTGMRVPSFDPTTGTITYEITEMGDNVHYNAGEVDQAIVSLESVKANVSFTITLKTLNVSSGIKCVTFNDLVLQMPKGLEAQPESGTYDATTGHWTIDEYVTDGYNASISIQASAIDFDMAGATIDANHRFTYDGEFKILSGYVSITPESLSEVLPTSLHFRTEYALSDLEATAFTGVVNYKLDGMDIDPVSLSDIPDFLDCEGTNILLANPQIYLQVNNPVADNALDCSTGITLTAIREGAAALPFSPDNGAFTIGHNKGVTGKYNFVLTPSKDNIAVPEAYADGLTFVKFTTLSDLLSSPTGNGMPDQIGITLNEPQIPTQHVTDFALGRTLPAVEGSYDLVAPLALKEGSKIIYTETEDGWNDEDVDALTITQLSLTATVTNQCPLAVEMVAWPIDVQGNRIPGVEIVSSRVEANSTDVPLTIKMTGKVQHLDGVVFEARVDGSADNTALAPTQTITLKKVRAVVSGYYEKEL